MIRVGGRLNIKIICRGCVKFFSCFRFLRIVWVEW